MQRASRCADDHRVRRRSTGVYVVEPDDPRRRARHLHRDLPARVVPAGPRDDPGQPRRPPGGRRRRPALPPAPGRLLVRARSARARVVLHDLRDGSPTDGATLTIDLGERPDGTHDHRGVFIPPGVAHGFAALTDMTITYLVDGYYNPADELGVAWDDPAIEADWGVTDPMLSERDQENPARATCRTSRRARLAACGRELAKHPRHRRRRLHRLQLRAPRPRAHRRRGHRLRRPHLRRQPLDAARRRRRPALPVREGQHLRPRAARGRDGAATTPSCTSPPRATSTARSSAPTTSSTRTASAPTWSWTSPGASRSARVVHIGTDEVYGSVEVGSSKETDPLEPRSPYSASKAGSDLIALSYHHTYGLPVSVTRCTNNFGPYQFPEKVIPLFTTNLLDGRQIPLYGDGAQRARLDLRRRPLRGRAPRARPRRAGRDLQHRRRQRDPEPRARRQAARAASAPARSRSSTSPTGSATTAATRSTSPRSPRSAGAAAHARRGARGDRRVVPRQPLVVGTAEAVGRVARHAHQDRGHRRGGLRRLQPRRYPAGGGLRGSSRSTT